MANAEQQFLTLTGVWTSDNRLELQPSFATSNAQGASLGNIEPENRLLIVELLGDREEVIARQPIAVSPLCFDRQAGRSDELFVCDKVLFPEETQALRFIRADNNTIIHKVERPKQQPEIQIDWEPPPGPLDGPHAITWSVSHRGRLPLHFFVLYSYTGGGSWQPIALPLEDSEVELDFDQLPGGERCLIKVLASDGVNTKEATSKAFPIAKKGLRAMILFPEDGATIRTRETTLLHGQGFHFEEQHWELEDLDWASSIDGELGSGPDIEVRLSRGSHDITLRAGEHTTQISVNVVD